MIFPRSPLIDRCVDTTTSAISIAIMAATLYPSASKQVQEELDRVVGRERRKSYSSSCKILAHHCSPQLRTTLTLEIYHTFKPLSKRSVGCIYKVKTILTSGLPQVHRWRPVASGGFAHATTEAVTYNGYVIPKGTALVGNHWSISRDPVVFPEPEEFLPERWFEDGDVKSGKIRKDINHVAFGFGRRVCSGRNVAERSVASESSRAISFSGHEND